VKNESHVKRRVEGCLDHIVSFSRTTLCVFTFCRDIPGVIQLYISTDRSVLKCQTPSKTQTDIETSGQTTGIEFGAF